jgi:hypothetical protein
MSFSHPFRRPDTIETRKAIIFSLEILNAVIFSMMNIELFDLIAKTMPQNSRRVQFAIQYPEWWSNGNIFDKTSPTNKRENRKQSPP